MLCCGSEEGDLHWFAVGLSVGGAGRGGALGRWQKELKVCILEKEKATRLSGLFLEKFYFAFMFYF